MENARGRFDLSPIRIEDLAGIRATAIEEGHSFHIEQNLEDDSNENSCAVTYYEVGVEGDSLNKKLTNTIMMQFLNEPFFNQLRTQQQLGYVVFSRPVNNRGVLGVQFMVQSPTRSCEYIVNCINEYLVGMRQKVLDISKEDFQTQRDAVKIKLAEQDLNLAGEYARNWNELSTHKYNFDRQSEEVAALDDISA